MRKQSTNGQHNGRRPIAAKQSPKASMGLGCDLNQSGCDQPKLTSLSENYGLV